VTVPSIDSSSSEFAAERPAGGQEISIDSKRRRKCGQCRVESRGKMLNTDLLPAKLLFDRFSLDGNFYVSNKMVSNAYHLPDNDKIVLFLRQLMPFCNDKS